MNTLKTLFFAGIIVLVLGFIPGCRAADTKAEPIGTVTGTATGHSLGYNGFMDVTVTMENGFIVSVDIRSPLDARSSIAGPVMAKAPDMIKRNNSAQIDNISGATETVRAIIQAAQHAIRQIAAAYEENGQSKEENEREPDDFLYLQ